jgi:3-oxoacyl-[acyl-carrier protein] reductase
MICTENRNDPNPDHVRRKRSTDRINPIVTRALAASWSSTSALTGMGSSFAYVTSKAALNTLTLALARALGPQIRVNCVLPGLIETRWLKEGLGEEVYNTVRQNFANSSALEKTCKPEDVADAIVWLIEGAGLVTGQLITVDGGFLLGKPPPVSR